MIYAQCLNEETNNDINELELSSQLLIENMNLQTVLLEATEDKRSVFSRLKKMIKDAVDKFMKQIDSILQKFKKNSKQNNTKNEPEKPQRDPVTIPLYEFGEVKFNFDKNIEGFISSPSDYYDETIENVHKYKEILDKRYTEFIMNLSGSVQESLSRCNLSITNIDDLNSIKYDRNHNTGKSFEINSNTTRTDIINIEYDLRDFHSDAVRSVKSSVRLLSITLGASLNILEDNLNKYTDFESKNPNRYAFAVYCGKVLNNILQNAIKVGTMYTNMVTRIYNANVADIKNCFNN